LRSVRDTQIGDTLGLRLNDGTLCCRIEGVKEHG